MEVGEKMEAKIDTPKSKITAASAKAAIRPSSVKFSPNRRPKSTKDIEDQEMKLWTPPVTDPKMDLENEALRSPIAIRCAKAAFSLSSLKFSVNRRLDSPKDIELEETKILKIAVADLKEELVRLRARNRTISCSLMETILLIAVLLFLWTMCLMLVLNSSDPQLRFAAT